MKPKFKSVRIYAFAHPLLEALTEAAKEKTGYRNLTYTEYLSNLIRKDAEEKGIVELEGTTVTEAAQ